MQNKSDENQRWGDLMAKAQDGDGSAYHTLLEEITPALRSFCQVRVGFLQEREEIVQEILLAIHGGRHTFDPRRSFCAWMYAIARYKIIDFLRKAQKLQKFQEFDEKYVTFSEGSANGQAGEESEMVHSLREVMGSLSPKYRQVIDLLKFQGLSIQEAAAHVGISESALKVRAHRAYRTLFRKMEKKVHG